MMHMQIAQVGIETENNSAAARAAHAAAEAAKERAALLHAECAKVTGSADVNEEERIQVERDMDNAREQGNQYLSELSRLQVSATKLQQLRKEALADLESARTRSLDRQREQHRVETSLRSVTKHLESAKAGLENMIARRQTAHAAVERLKTSLDQAREARIAAEEYDLQRKTEHRTTGDMVELATETEETATRLAAAREHLEQVTGDLAAVEAQLRQENNVARAALQHESAVFRAEEVTLVEEEVELHHV